MKYILLIILLITTACCTPGACPQEDIYINAMLQDGTQALVKVPKGTLDDPDSYYTQEEINSMMESFRKDGI